MGQNVEQRTGSTFGRVMVTAGLLVAFLGALLVAVSMISGNAGAPLTWGMIIVGLLLAAIGFGARILAAVEKR